MVKIRRMNLKAAIEYGEHMHDSLLVLSVKKIFYYHLNSIYMETLVAIIELFNTLYLSSKNFIENQITFIRNLGCILF